MLRFSLTPGCSPVENGVDGKSRFNGLPAALQSR
jgi:hypothetical protein